MKKIILKVSILSIVSIALFNIALNFQNEKLSNLNLLNVDALASGEASTHDCPDGPTLCVVVNSGSQYVFHKGN